MWTRGSSGFLPPVAVLLRSFLRLDFEIGDEQEIDDVQAVIRLKHGSRAAAAGEREKLAVLHRHFPPVGQMDDEAAKRLGVQDCEDALAGH